MEEFLALLRDELRWPDETLRRADEARLSERFIQIGTSEMYGSVDHPTTEEEPIKPSSPYAASKVAFDMYLLSVHKFLKFPMNIIRPSNAYCPGQLLHRVIPKAVWCGLKGVKLPLHGGGRAEKSYMHARDLGRAIQLVAEKAELGKITMQGRPSRPRSARLSNGPLSRSAFPSNSFAK